MAETKRVSDQYTISSPTIVLDGNLTIMGSTTSIEAINSTIKDNIIIINQDEVGAGVTLGSAGIEVERGSLSNTTLLFNETADAWEIKIGGSFAVVRGGEPSASNDLTTKTYVDTAIEALSPAGTVGQLQYNDGAVFGASNLLTWNNSELLIQDLSLGVSNISCTTTNGDLRIETNGTGKIVIPNAIRVDNLLADPNTENDSTVVWAKAPAEGGTGLYFTNTTATDELVSRSKAILYSLIF